MLVSHRNNFIYTKTAKTAGTSVESYFEKFCMPESEWRPSHGREQHVSEAGIVGFRGADVGDRLWFNHMSARAIRERLGYRVWSRYFKFCVVRNPYDMLISWFFFQLRREGADPGSREGIVREFRRRMSSGIPVLGRDKYVIDGRLCVDYLIRFEALEKDIEAVCDLLDLPFERDRIPRYKSSFRDASIPLGDFYTPTLVRSVAEAYRFELENFAYAFPGSGPL